MSDSDAVLIVEHVKCRNSDAGRSPIGTLYVFKEHVEWRDASSPNRTKIPFADIKGQRVSPPHKPKVQLQICMHAEDQQTTFVFLKPGANRDELAAERDLVKETLQQALVAHRQRVQQLTAATEDTAKKAGLEAKQRILRQSKQLEELYKHLVTTKLITPQDFWRDYYTGKGETEERTGMTGAFLANVAQSDTNGLKLNLNTSIIQSIFATYPTVERKHLELVPHEMSEEDFWVKFATSHYFHREREVLPNPDDPFADCVKQDEAEMAKLIGEGPKRRRLDFGYLNDNVGFAGEEGAAASSQRREMPLTGKAAAKTTLIRRCNYLSERILSTQLASANAASSSSSMEVATVPNGNGNTSGYAALHRWIGEDASAGVDSADLAEEGDEAQMQIVRVPDQRAVAAAQYPAKEAARARKIVLDFLDSVTEDEVLDADEDWLQPSSLAMNGNTSSSSSDHATVGLDPATQWGPLGPYLSDVRVVHDAVSELCKHFWTCFPPTSPELEAKVERMNKTIEKYETSTLLEAEHRFGENAFVHCRDMISRVHARYGVFVARRKR